MEKRKIERINELARKARNTELTEDEKIERAALREEYLAAVRTNFKAILDNIGHL